MMSFYEICFPIDFGHEACRERILSSYSDEAVVLANKCYEEDVEVYEFAGKKSVKESVLLQEQLDAEVY